MGGVAVLLGFLRGKRGDANLSDVKADRGGSDNRTTEHFSAPGDDSHPLEGDYVALVDQQGEGRSSAVGYVDPKNSQKAREGDKRIYARDPSTGDAVAEVWLKNDGSATTSNSNGSFTLNADGGQKGQNSSGSFELKANGDFVVNGVIIKPNGNVIMPNSLALNGKEIDGHAHSQANDSGGNIEQDTGPNQ